MRAKQWKIHRSAIERDDGQRRWDEAYQFLLHCMLHCMAENCEKTTDEKSHEKSRQQEEQDGSSTVCSCINHTATAGSDN